METRESRRKTGRAGPWLARCFSVTALMALALAFSAGAWATTSVSITSPTTASPVTFTSHCFAVFVEFDWDARSISNTLITTTATALVLSGGTTIASNSIIGLRTGSSGHNGMIVVTPRATPNGTYDVQVTLHFSSAAFPDKVDKQTGAFILAVSPPTLSGCPPATLPSVPANGSCQGLVPDVLGGVTASNGDNLICFVNDVTVTQSPAAGTLVDLGAHTITITAADLAGNSSTCPTSFTVADTTPPVITLNGSSTMTVECHAAFSDPGATASDSCAGSFPATPSGTVDANTPGSYTLTYNATDGTNAATPVTRTVTVVDTTPPVVTLNGPSSVTVECHTSFTDPGAAASDSCAGSVPVVVSGSVDANIPGTYTLTYTATDPAGNSATPVTRTVKVVDTTPPVISGCPTSAVNLSTGPSATSCSATWSSPPTITAADNCAGSVPVGCTRSDDPSKRLNDPFPVGTTHVTCTATDGTNTATCKFDVVVTDTTPPVISCPSSVNVNNDPGQCSATLSPTPSATASDNCDGTFAATGTRSDGKVLSAPYPVGVTTITWTATDSPGNPAVSCRQTVTVNDTEKPQISGCPSNITVYTGLGRTTCDQVATWTAPTASDNCSVISFSSNHNPGDTFPVGPTTVTYTAMDAGGNTKICSFTVTVVDNTPPTINCPGNITTNTDPGHCTAVVNFTVTATDNCTGVGSVVCTPPSGSTFPKGTTTVNCTVTDAAGKSSNCSFTVTVNDTENPTITCPADLTDVPTDAGLCAASRVVLGSASTGDNCGVAMVTNDAPASFPKGTTTVTWKVTDTSGNTATCTQKVTVKDHENPKITCPANLTNIPNDPGKCAATLSPTPSAIATDNCDGTFAATGTRSDGKALSAPYPVGVTTITWTATDLRGNSATSCTQTVTVTDNEAPVINCPSNVTVNNDLGLCSATPTTTPAATATDNCDGTIAAKGTRSDGKLLTDPYPVGVTTITWTATDSHGNPNTLPCIQTVTVKDAQAPTFTSCPGKQTLPVTCLPGGIIGAVPSFNSPTSWDDCGLAGVVSCTAQLLDTNGSPVGSAVPAISGVTPLMPGTWRVTSMATDTSGNMSTCSFNVAVTYSSSWTGVLQPVNADGTSVFKLGSTIPVKFQLTGASACVDGNTSFVAKLYVSLSSNVVIGPVDEAISTAAADVGNQFRYDQTSQQYIFNLGTKSLNKGTYYMRIDLGDGVNDGTHTIKFGLK